MKYNYKLMQKFFDSKPIWGHGAASFQHDHGIPPATYYRWLKKYRAGVGSDSRAEKINNRHGEEIAKLKSMHAKEIMELKRHGNEIIDENMQAFIDHVDGLLIVHTDIDLDDLLANTKAIFEMERFSDASMARR